MLLGGFVVEFQEQICRPQRELAIRSLPSWWCWLGSGFAGQQDAPHYQMTRLCKSARSARPGGTGSREVQVPRGIERSPPVEMPSPWRSKIEST